MGYVYGNLMVNVQPTNEKLRDRARRIVAQAAGVPYDRAGELLDAAGDSVRAAIVMAQDRRQPRGGGDGAWQRPSGRISRRLSHG